MKHSVKILILSVIAVVFLLSTQNSAFAKKNTGKVVHFQDKEGSYYKTPGSSNNSNQVVWQKTTPNSKPFNPVNKRPTRKAKTYSILSVKQNQFVNIYLERLKRILRAYQF